MDRRHRLAHESRILACVRLWRPEPLDVGLVPDLMTDIPALEVQRRCLGKMRKSGNVSCGSRDAAAMIGMPIVHNEKSAHSTRFQRVHHRIVSEKAISTAP